VPQRALTTCSTPGCGQLVKSGRCDDCATIAERQRGSSSARGYGKRHRDRFRRAVIERDICCVLCITHGQWTLATVADHWPLSRRELVERGMDADDPDHGRGLCHDCHSKETAINQPGGFNQAT
jgi:5-methylcytosine-specific restriction protein A